MTGPTTEAGIAVVAVSAGMRELLDIVERLAETRSPVLLQGESGTGKDMVAHLLHYSGARSNGPFIKVHCPSIPEDLLESELFGHEQGAFTDADRMKLGKIEMANGGTLYFDQIQDLSPALQAKLLRVVEEHRFERLGGTRTIEVDVRIISSCNVDLRQAVEQRVFRADLFHRLSVVPLVLPPLRERGEDIVPLAELFLVRESERSGGPARRFDPDALAALKGYDWPGNVRELRSLVEHAALLADGESVRLVALPASIMTRPEVLWTGREQLLSLKELERSYMRYVIDRVGGSQTRAAAILGISRKSLWERRRRLGLP
jgi:two-component system, NtrC family, response regulator AtoC